MDSKHLEELTKTIAERNGTTPEAVRREMEAARNSAWDTDDSSARGPVSYTHLTLPTIFRV